MNNEPDDAVISKLQVLERESIARGIPIIGSKKVLGCCRKYGKQNRRGYWN